jgi:nicotinate-nucleotide adenylyltransferase
MSTREKPLLGLFGGTFNPIHLGHLRAAEEVAAVLELERVLFLPAAIPPHKHAGDETIAPPGARLEWVRMAVAGNPRFGVDTLELERPGPSYSVDTLRTLREREPSRELVFLIGLDAFAEIGSWKEPETLLQLAHFAVFTRPPAKPGRLLEWLPESLRASLQIAPDGRSARHRRAGTWIRWLEIRALDVSATELRRLLGADLSVRYLIPEAARLAILASGHYAKKESP